MEFIDENEDYKSLMKELKELDRYAVEIGVFGEDDSFYAMIATVHEFGMHIKAKNGKNLSIPVHKNAVGKSPKDFSGLQPMFSRKNGVPEVYGLGMPKGKELEMYFLLKESVNIPERSFIRSTFDDRNDEWMSFVEERIQRVCDLEMTAKQVFEQLGAKIAGDIQKRMTQLRSPKNAALTTSNKGSSNPLLNTGELRRHVTWKVVSNSADV